MVRHSLVAGGDGLPVGPYMGVVGEAVSVRPLERSAAAVLGDLDEAQRDALALRGGHRVASQTSSQRAT